MHELLHIHTLTMLGEAAVPSSQELIHEEKVINILAKSLVELDRRSAFA